MKNQYFTLEIQYADDISKISNNTAEIEQTKKSLPKILKKRGLIMNETKTEEYIISKNEEKWKKCKFLGSLLGTDEDINRRKGLAINCLKPMKKYFTNKKLTIKTKTKLFNTYVGSIFLFNSELWTLKKTDEKKIDCFHRRLLRTNILNSIWPKTMRNDEVYKRTKQTAWSKIIKTRRIRWFGHVARLHQETPARKALEYAMKTIKHPVGTPKTTWLKVMKSQLKDHKMSFYEALEKAKDRKFWRSLTKGSAM